MSLKLSTLKTSIISGLGLLCFLAQPAFAEVILQHFCRRDICHQTKFISKTAPRQSATGTFYTIETADRSWRYGEQPGNTWSEPEISYVNCSTTRPAYIFSLPSFSYLFVHLINPGEPHQQFSMSGSEEMYWVTCHNFVGPFSDYDTGESFMTERARQLGYPLNLPLDQLEADSEAELLELFGVSQN